MPQPFASATAFFPGALADAVEQVMRDSHLKDMSRYGLVSAHHLCFPPCHHVDLLNFEPRAIAFYDTKQKAPKKRHATKKLMQTPHVRIMLLPVLVSPWGATLLQTL